jgi:heme/copper-type cytochrome/quinol oxidase subunit 2
VPSVGTSIFLIAVGAILRYAVTANVEGVSLTTVGLILMLVGILGLAISLLFLFVWSPRGRRVNERERYYDDPTRPR